MSSGAGDPRSRPALVRMLDEIATWREAAGRAADATLEAIAAEERAAQFALDEAQRRHAALLVIRREEEERVASFEDEALRRKRASVRQALVADRELLEGRADMLLARRAEADAALAEQLADPSMASALRLWLEARETAATVGDMDVARWVPPAARARLQPLIDAAGSFPALGCEPAGVGVLISADPPVGCPEALVLVLPVPWAVHGEGTARPEDLCTLLAYRLVAGVYRLLADIGAAHAPVRFSDLQGSLAVQVWLGDSRIEEDLRERVLEGVAAAVDGAEELAAAAVEVYAVWLTPELLAEAVS